MGARTLHRPEITFVINLLLNVSDGRVMTFSPSKQGFNSLPDLACLVKNFCLSILAGWWALSKERIVEFVFSIIIIENLSIVKLLIEVNVWTKGGKQNTKKEFYRRWQISKSQSVFWKSNKHKHSIVLTNPFSCHIPFGSDRFLPHIQLWDWLLDALRYKQSVSEHHAHVKTPILWFLCLSITCSLQRSMIKVTYGIFLSLLDSVKALGITLPVARVFLCHLLAIIV